MSCCFDIVSVPSTNPLDGTRHKKLVFNTEKTVLTALVALAFVAVFAMLSGH